MADEIEVLTGKQQTLEIHQPGSTISDVTPDPGAVEIITATPTQTVEVIGAGDTIVQVAYNRGAKGEQGPRGEPGRDVLPTDPRLVYGEAVGVIPGTTVSVARIIGEDKLKLRGFNVTGNGDGTFRLDINGVVIMAARISRLNPFIHVPIPSGWHLPRGSVATVTIACDAAGPAHYEATILGEVPNG